MGLPLWRIDPVTFHEELIDIADEAIHEVAGSGLGLPSGPLHDAAGNGSSENVDGDALPSRACEASRPPGKRTRATSTWLWPMAAPRLDSADKTMGRWLAGSPGAQRSGPAQGAVPPGAVGLFSQDDRGLWAAEPFTVSRMTLLRDVPDSYAGSRGDVERGQWARLLLEHEPAFTFCTGL